MSKLAVWRNGRIRALAWVAAVPCCWYQSSFAASFDCQKAKSVPEHLICTTPELSRADDDLKLLFDAAREKARDKAAFKESARQSWNDREKNCRGVSCLQKWYIAQKDYYTQLLDGTKGAPSAPSIQDTRPFYQNPVYGIGPGLQVCEEFSSVPTGLWGNHEEVEVSATVGETGRSLAVVGVRQDHSKSVYQFFFLKSECLATAGHGLKTEGPPTQQAHHVSEPLSANPDLGDASQSQKRIEPQIPTITVTELHRLSKAGMMINKLYKVGTSISGYDNFGDSLCDVTRYDGYCETSDVSVQVSQEALSRQKRMELYDLRGKSGGQLCAVVEMSPDGILLLTDFTAGRCL